MPITPELLKDVEKSPSIMTDWAKVKLAHALWIERKSQKLHKFGRVDFFSTTYFIPVSANDFGRNEVRKLGISLQPGNVASYVRKFNNLVGFPLIIRTQNKYMVSLFNLGGWREVEGINLTEPATQAKIMGQLDWIGHLLNNPYMRMLFYHRAAGDRTIDFVSGNADIDPVPNLEKWETVGDYILGLRNLITEKSSMEKAYNFIMNSQFHGRGTSIELTMNKYSRQWMKYVQKVSLAPFFNKIEEGELKKRFNSYVNQGVNTIRNNPAFFRAPKDNELKTINLR